MSRTSVDTGIYRPNGLNAIKNYQQRQLEGRVDEDFAKEI
jgi:hypothetical protein